MEIASVKSTDQFFQKIAQQKAILIFSAILAKRGNLNLDLNLVRGYNFFFKYRFWCRQQFFFVWVYART